MPDPLLTTADAAAYLHVSPRTLEKWRLHGGGPRYRKLVRRVVYTQHDIDTWVEEKARTSTSDPGPGSGAGTGPLPPTPRAAAHALPTRRRARKAPRVQTSPLPGELSTAFPPLFPRQPLELLVLETLAAMAPIPFTPRQMTEILQQPHDAVRATLHALATLGTIQHLRAGYYSHGPGTPNQPPLKQRGGSRPRRPGPDLLPSSRYAAQIARIVAQDGSRETGPSPTRGDKGRHACRPLTSAPRT